MNVVRLRVVADDTEARRVTVEWPDGARITIPYPASVGSPYDIGWFEANTAFAWCLVVNRVPWVFAFDID